MTERQQQGCWASCRGNLSLVGHSSLGRTLAIASEHLPAAGMTGIFFDKQMKARKAFRAQFDAQSAILSLCFVIML